MIGLVIYVVSVIGMWFFKGYWEKNGSNDNLFVMLKKDTLRAWCDESHSNSERWSTTILNVLVFFIPIVVSVILIMNIVLFIGVWLSNTKISPIISNKFSPFYLKLFYGKDCNELENEDY